MIYNMTEDQEKAIKLLFERILWNQRYQNEILNIISLYFKNPDLFSRNRRVTKAAISSAVNFVSSIACLQPLYYASSIDKTGGIMLVSEQDVPSTVIITERGTVLMAEKDVAKYIEYYNI
jgi:hypothetical protein